MITLRRSTHQRSIADRGNRLLFLMFSRRHAAALPLRSTAAMTRTFVTQEAVMRRQIGTFLAALAILGSGQAFAQEITPGQGTVEVTVIPGGGTFFTSSDKGPSFGSYNLGGALTYNVNRIVGIEGEVGGTLGIAQNLQFGGSSLSTTRTPDQLNYTANVVVSAPTHASTVPYVTGGIGGLTMFERPAFGVTSTTTLLTGNVGGGVKWYAPNGRWGLRGDYRFVSVRSDASAPAFFGQETRYGHRVYGAVLINAVR
jgi:opacity protein-like surface antigen